MTLKYTLIDTHIVNVIMYNNFYIIKVMIMIHTYNSRTHALEELKFLSLSVKLKKETEGVS